MVASADGLGHPGRAGDAGPGRQRRRRRHRHQRGHCRHRPAPVRHGWRPVRAGAPRQGTCVHCLNASGRSGSGASGSRAARRGPFGDAVPPRRAHRHRARLRRRLGGAPRALRHAADGSTARARHRAGPRRLPRQPVARRLPDPPRPAGPRGPARARRARRTARAIVFAGPASPPRCEPSPTAVATRSTRATSARACCSWATGGSRQPTWPAARPTGSHRCRRRRGESTCSPCPRTRRATSRSARRPSPATSSCRPTPATSAGRTC